MLLRPITYKYTHATYAAALSLTLAAWWQCVCSLHRCHRFPTASSFCGLTIAAFPAACVKNVEEKKKIDKGGRERE